MDRQPILDHSSASSAVEGDMPVTGATRSTPASVSAGIAAANAHMPKAPEPRPRFPPEDGGRSLFEMAHSDLDAALQLLAERAHYITGASGAAIALRRGQHNDMLCRASAGSNAPELGALLSMDYGLSGESVRTRQVLRCDDAERDPRVNHEVCRQLGIASVVVMPIASDQQVIGVFELLSGKPRAFDERDLSALQRLGEMVEIAVMHAAAAQTLQAQTIPESEELDIAEPRLSVPVTAAEAGQVDYPRNVAEPEVVSAAPEKDIPQPELKPQEATPAAPRPVELIKTALEKTTPEPSPKKPLCWSALPTQDTAARSDATESIAVPPGLRNLQKCQACGFPVSQGRTFCVECEEKQWRSQRLPHPVAGATQQAQREAESRVVRRIEIEDDPGISVSNDLSSARTKEPRNGDRAIPADAATEASSPPRSVPHDVPPDVSGFDNSAPFLGSAVESQSWFAANQYVLGALLAVAIVIGVIALVR